MLALVITVLVFVNASDGDTLTVRDGNLKTVLRLAEVDAPERTQPWSQVSRRNLVALCKDKRIEFQPVSAAKDRHHRHGRRHRPSVNICLLADVLPPFLHLAKVTTEVTTFALCPAHSWSVQLQCGYL